MNPITVTEISEGVYLVQIVEPKSPAQPVDYFELAMEHFKAIEEDPIF